MGKGLVLFGFVRGDNLGEGSLSLSVYFKLEALKDGHCLLALFYQNCVFAALFLSIRFRTRKEAQKILVTGSAGSLF